MVYCWRIVLDETALAVNDCGSVCWNTIERINGHMSQIGWVWRERDKIRKDAELNG